MIFWDFLMFDEIFMSLQVKRIVIKSCSILAKNRNWTFPVGSYFTQKLEFVWNILTRIVIISNFIKAKQLHLKKVSLINGILLNGVLIHNLLINLVTSWFLAWIFSDHKWHNFIQALIFFYLVLLTPEFFFHCFCIV